MDFDLSAEHELFRDTVRAFAVDRVGPVAEEIDREGRFPYEIVDDHSLLTDPDEPRPPTISGTIVQMRVVVDTSVL